MELSRSIDPPSEDFERALATIFLSISSRDSSTRLLEETDFDEIRRLLSHQPSFADRPRTYTVLRVIECLELMPTFIKHGLSDIAFPYSEERVPKFMNPRQKKSFLESQSLVLTSKAHDLENSRGKHQHFQYDADQHFVVGPPLGAGGFGEVDRVRSKLSLKVYARKRIRITNKRGWEKIFKSFTNEVNSLRRLKHRHLITLLGSYTDPKYVGFIMAEVADCDLREYLKITPVNKPSLRRFFGCLTSAVAYLHDSHVRHKDLKPGNILVKDHKVLLTDFGTALDWSDLTRSTTRNQPSAAYTPEYAAPEVAEYKDRNSSTDIYSLGLVFNDMITILKNESFENRTTHFQNKGSFLGFASKNPDGLESWLVYLESKSREDNQPIVWIRKMTQSRSMDRIKARELFDDIFSYQDVYKYYSSCCLPIEETIDFSQEAHGGNGEEYHVTATRHSERQNSFPIDQTTEPQYTPPSTNDSSTAEREEKLRSAAMDGSLLSVKRLLSQGVNIEAASNLGGTPLIHAAHGATNVLEYLLSKGANMLATDISGYNALHIAAYKATTKEIEILLAYKMNINSQTNDGRTPLQLACSEGKEENAAFLVQKGADTNRRSFKGWTALLYCAMSGSVPIAHMLFDQKHNDHLDSISLDAKLSTGINALHLAADEGHYAMVELLLSRGMDVEARTNFDWTPLHFACRSDHEAVAKLLLEYGADIEARDTRDYTPLHAAVSCGGEGSLMMLLDEGADLSAVVKPDGLLHVHIAARNGRAPMLRLLSVLGADLMAPSSTGDTALHETAIFRGGVTPDDEQILGRIECARMILESGGDVNAYDHSGYTALHWAADYGCEPLVELLILFGADINRETFETEYRPLDHAISSGRENIVDLLLKEGAQTFYGDGRPMYLASQGGHEGIAQKVIKAGTDMSGYEEFLDMADDQGNTDKDKNPVGSEEMSHADMLAIQQIMEDDESNVSSDSDDSLSGMYINRTTNAPSRRTEQQTLLTNPTSKQENVPKLKITPIGTLARQANPKDTEAIRRLCGFGYDEDIVKDVYYTISSRNEKEAQETLLDIYGDMDKPETQESSEDLIQAVRTGDLVKLKLCLEGSHQLDEIDGKDQSPLMAASMLGHEKVVRALLENGAQIALSNSQGYTALHFASESGNQEVAAVLLEYGADSEAKSKSGWTPIGCGGPSMASFLRAFKMPMGKQELTPTLPILQGKFYPEPHDTEPQIPTSKAKETQNTGQDIKNAEKKTLPLRKKPPPPIPKKKPDLLKNWTPPPPKIGAQHSGPSTPLNTINYDTVKLLGQQSLEPISNKTPSQQATQSSQRLFEAIQTGTIIQVITLLKSKPSLAVTDDQGNTALHLCVTHGNHTMARLIIKAGADVNASNSLGNTTLHKAAQMGKFAFVKFLLDAGASVNLRNQEGLTPLHVAAFYGQSVIVKMLLKKGADVNLKDREGNGVLETARMGERLHVADRKAYQGVVELISKAE